MAGQLQQQQRGGVISRFQNAPKPPKFEICLLQVLLWGPPVFDSPYLRKFLGLGGVISRFISSYKTSRTIVQDLVLRFRYFKFDAGTGKTTFKICVYEKRKDVCIIIIPNISCRTKYNTMPKCIRSYFKIDSNLLVSPYYHAPNKKCFPTLTYLQRSDP